MNVGSALQNGVLQKRVHDSDNRQILRQFFQIFRRVFITFFFFLVGNFFEFRFQYHKGLKAEFKEITDEKKEEGDENAPKDLKELAQDLPIVRIVDTLLEYAILEGASDIHIEPTEKSVIVRYRVDGVLKDVMTLPKNAQAGILARIKILANL